MMEQTWLDAKEWFAELLIVLQDMGFIPPDPGRVEALGQQGKAMEERWAQTSQYIQFMITFTAITTVMTKLLPKDLEVLDRRQEKEKEEKEAREKEKEAKKENAGSKKKDPSNSKDANTGGDAAAGGTDAGAEGTEEPEQAPARRPNPIPYIIIGLVLLQIHMDDILSLLGLRAKPGRPVFSTNQDQPLWGKTEYFIPGQRLKDMQGGLQQHAWSTPGVRGYSSDQVDGFRVSFDVHGLEQFEAAPETQHLAAFFKRARLSEANAWSMSVYSVRPATGAADALSLKLRQMTSGLLDLPQPHVAHHLDLLWLRVPDDCSGGHLQIWNHKRGDPLSSAVVLDAPDKVLEPEENTNLQIRGDAYIQIDPFRSRNNLDRLVVLLLEQYVIAPEKLETARHYLVHEKSVQEEEEERRARVAQAVEDAAQHK